MRESTEHAIWRSAAASYDGEAPVEFERLPLPPPRVERALGGDFVVVDPSSLAALAERAFRDIQFRLRCSFVEALAEAASDPGADPRDAYVTETLLANASISSAGVFPLCQDTGTATAFGWKGERVFVERAEGGLEGDEAALAAGAAAAWKAARLRNSQVLPLPGLDERNSGDNSPLSSHIAASEGSEYRFAFVAKGGGSANKTRLYQETKRLLSPGVLEGFVSEAVASIGVSACPPYRIALVLGGQSAEESVLASKLASAGVLDALPAHPGPDGGPYRDRGLEGMVVRAAAASGWGAQLGGRFLAHDARVIRLPRHAASLPAAVAVSCSAHRQAYAYVSRDGFFVERLCDGQELESAIKDAAGKAPRPAGIGAEFGSPRRVDLGEPGSAEARASIASLKAGELVGLWGKAVLVRDAAHARIRSMIERGEPLPSWTRFPAYYASPTGAPEGAVVGSIGPTTSKRMDSYLEDFGARGLFPLSVGKGERGPECREACAKYGGAYLAAVGGAAALAATSYVASCEVIDWPELGMEAIRLVEFSGLPAIVAVDPTGKDYYEELRRPPPNAHINPSADA